MWIARSDVSRPASITHTAVESSPMWTRICASSSLQRSAESAALIIAVASISASWGSKPASAHTSSTPRRSRFGTAVTSSWDSVSVRSWTTKSTITSSMFHCGSSPSTSNLRTSSIFASSVIGTRSERNAASPESTAMLIASKGTLCARTASRRAATASASSPGRYSPVVKATNRCLRGLPSRTTSSKRRGPMRMPQERVIEEGVGVGRRRGPVHGAGPVSRGVGPGRPGSLGAQRGSPSAAGSVEGGQLEASASRSNSALSASAST